MLRTGEVSSREVTQVFLDRIESLEPHLHAFLTLIPEKALSQADISDQRLAAWRKNPEERLQPRTLCCRYTLHLRLSNPGKFYATLQRHRGTTTIGRWCSHPGENQYR